MQNKASEEKRIAGYETRDVNIRGLVIFAAGLVVTLAVTAAILAGLFRYYSASQSLGPPASPFADTRTLPPEPRLQVTPQQDLSELRRTSDMALNTYAWVDQKDGVVRIPIDRAMDLLLQRGLPVREKKNEEVRK